LKNAPLTAPKVFASAAFAPFGNPPTCRRRARQPTFREVAPETREVAPETAGNGPFVRNPG